MSNATTLEPTDILADCQLLNSTDEIYTKYPIIQRFGSPEQAILVNPNTVEINEIAYAQPLILPLYNGQLKQVQCAVLCDQKRIEFTEGSIANGFAYFGKLAKDQPIIITYGLEAFFKLAQTSYAVVLVMLPTLCTHPLREHSKTDIQQIQFVVQLLFKSGYEQLYIPLRPEHKTLRQQLEVSPQAKFIEQYTAEDSIDLSQYDDVRDVQIFFDESIKAIPQSVLPAGHIAKPFKLDDGAQLHILENGLYLTKEQYAEDGEPKTSQTFISHSAMILGEARSLKNDNWMRVVQFKDKDNQQHTLLIPYEHFMGEAQDALKIIANHGLMPPRKLYKKNIFIHYIQDYPVEKRFRCVSQTGWHLGAYVTPHKTYGKYEDEDLLFHSDVKSPYGCSGTFEGWQELSKLLEPHALGVLALSSAFTGQLVSLLEVESGGFHLHGDSSTGKSTLIKASCSVWGSPKSFSKSWRTTDNALENEAELRNDSFLSLDELRQASPKAVSDVIYMLTGGQGKARSSKSGKNKDAKQFSLMYISNGEITLEEMLRRGNIELDAGLLLRFAHLPIDAGKGYGAFEQINYGSSPQELSNHLSAISAQHYGHAGIRWLEFLVKSKQDIIEYGHSLLNQFIHQHTTKNMTGQVSRVLRRFALVAVAGQLASEAGITGWKHERAFEAMGQCFKIWFDHCGADGNLEERKILERIKGFFEAHGTSRFENLTVLRQPNGDLIQPRIYNRVGYYDPETKTYLVSPTMFKQEMCIGINEVSARKILCQRGWIKIFTEGDKKLHTKKTILSDGIRQRMMHFDVEAMQSE